MSVHQTAREEPHLRLRFATLLLLFLILMPAHPSIRSSFISAQTLKGIASYYARSFTGRRTANGELLHHDSLTCAHRTLPFGTRLLVTNPKNGLSVVVRVNDRGPYRHKRIIDLTLAAARRIGILQQGVALVEVEKYDDVVIPFKDDRPIEMPRFIFVNPNDDATQTPAWQEELPLDHGEISRKMRKTAERSHIDYLRSRTKR